MHNLAVETQPIREGDYSTVNREITAWRHGSRSKGRLFAERMEKI
jgi:hypothetical protein